MRVLKALCKAVAMGIALLVVAVIVVLFYVGNSNAIDHVSGVLNIFFVNSEIDVALPEIIKMSRAFIVIFWIGFFGYFFGFWKWFLGGLGLKWFED